MYSHLFFPSDQSPASAAAFEHLRQMALRFEAQVTLFIADEFLAISTLGAFSLPSAEVMTELERTIQQSGQEHLEALKSLLTADGISCQILVNRGHAGQLIVEQALQSGSDLIVMGSRGHGALRSALLGSVSNYVIHHSQIPVMLIPNR